MPNTHPNWSKKELEIYMLIYCANANYSESKDEKNFIKSRSAQADYQKMHAEFEKDNDYQSIQKIQESIEHHAYSQGEKNQLFDEIKEMIKLEDKGEILEENIFRGLKHLL